MFCFVRNDTYLKVERMRVLMLKSVDDVVEDASKLLYITCSACAFVRVHAIALPFYSRRWLRKMNSCYTFNISRDVIFDWIWPWVGLKYQERFEDGFDGF